MLAHLALTFIYSAVILEKALAGVNGRTDILAIIVSLASYIIMLGIIWLQGTLITISAVSSILYMYYLNEGTDLIGKHLFV